MKTTSKTWAALLVAFCSHGNSLSLTAAENLVVGNVRVQLLSDSLVRLEAKGAEGFEDRPTFHVVERQWPGTTFTSNRVSGQIVATTSRYVVHVPQDGSSLAGVSVTSPGGRVLYRYDGLLTNSVWLPGPSENPTVLSFADTPRLIPPPWGATPAPPGAPLAPTSGWETNNDAPDIYVFIPGGSYRRLRADFLKLTGPTEMVPLYALGAFDSRWFDYSEATALEQIDGYRTRRIPLDLLVIDTGWRQNASTGYQPNTNLFPNLPRFFSEAHAKHVRIMFNDHPEPVAAAALDPAEVAYRYTNLTHLLGEGLDVWWYDRNWMVSLRSPARNLRKEVWGMRVYRDATYRTNAPLRPLIMANVDGIDNGIRHRPMDVAAHRFSIQWTGDIGPGYEALRRGVENAVQAGVQSLFPYMSEDLGGHTGDPTVEGYIRWIEYGALSPVYRPHCTHHLERMPWAFGPEAESVARRFLNLRYRLLPVFYAAARKNFDTGEPLLRRLDLDYPQFSQASRNSQYLLGHSILVAPVTQSGLSVVPSSWFTTPNGETGLLGEYFPNTNLSGTPVISRVDSNIDFDWAGGTPGQPLRADNFSARWTGKLAVPPGVGEVTLAATSDDGVRVWIDGQLCLDNWGPNDSVTTESSLILREGRTYPVRVEYLELSYNASLRLKWRSTSEPQVVPVWIPPSTWINAWDGTLMTGPVSITNKVPLGQIPVYIRSGSIVALAPGMQYTGQAPWDPITLDVYPSAGETNATSLYEDDTLTTAYKRGEFRTTAIAMWVDDTNKEVSVSIEPVQGTFPGALTERSWRVRLRRPPDWPADFAPAQVTLNGNAIGPIVHRVKDGWAMPLGAETGAPDADVFEVAVPSSSVAIRNVIVTRFASVRR